MAKIRTLVVDDNARFVIAAENFLCADARIEVLPSAGSGEDALHSVERDRPDLVLMDLHLPGMNGLEATLRIKAGIAAPKVVMLSLEDGPAARGEARSAGVDAFLNKAQVATDLMPVIDRLFQYHEPAEQGRRPQDWSERLLE